MSKINLTDATTLTNETSFVSTLNTNFSTIEAASDLFLSRDGTSPNSMAADLDMNSYSILNLPAPSTGTEPLRLQDYNTVLSGGTITAGSPVSASYVTLGSNSTLTAERTLTAGFGISLTDGGANSTATIAAVTPWVYAKDYGVVADGTTDCTTFIQNALNTGGIVILPKGNIKISSSLTISLTGTGLIGMGMLDTFLISSVNNASAIIVGSGVTWVTIQDFSISRTPTAISGGSGIVFNGNTELSQVRRMYIEKQYIGIFCQTTNQSSITDCVITDCQNDGLVINNTASSGTCQWFIQNVISERNVGRGFLIAAIAGPSGVTLGEMGNLYSFANTGIGFYALGLVAVPINGIRLANCFFGSDGSHSVLLDTYGGLHVFNKVFTELAGRVATGPGQLTSASSVGSGFNFTANNTNIEMSNCRATTHSEKGLVSSATILGIIGGAFTGNALAGATAGISIGAASTVRIIGARSNGASQNFGIALAAAVINGVIEGCDLTGTGGSISDASTGVTLRIINNTGYNPVGVTAAATMGASPTTVTCGHAPETHYVRQSATNTATIAKGSQQIATLAGATTYYTIELGPNESYVTTWTTTAPTYTKDVH